MREGEQQLLTVLGLLFVGKYSLMVQRGCTMGSALHSCSYPRYPYQGRPDFAMSGRAVIPAVAPGDSGTALPGQWLAHRGLRWPGGPATFTLPLSGRARYRLSILLQ
jgi:hypothetical protein